jgi:hypothetical protein
VQTDVTGFRNLVEAAVAQAGPRRCVIWSTIWLHGPNLAFNRVLREAAGRHRNLEIADWAGLVGASPQLLAPDGIHGTPQGYQEKAAQVAGIVEHSCGRVTTLPGLADKPGTLANHPGE